MGKIVDVMTRAYEEFAQSYMAHPLITFLEAVGIELVY
jgi:hypothetical protein